MNIDSERTEKALQYLVDTDGEHARIKAEFKAKENLTKTILAYEFRDSTEKAQESKKMAAYASLTYCDHIEALKALEIDLQTMYNRRDTARLIIELYRTQSANTRKGNI